MVPAKGCSVDGIVWRDLTDRDFEIMDRYEGCNTQTPVYQRERRKAIVKDGKRKFGRILGRRRF